MMQDNKINKTMNKTETDLQVTYKENKTFKQIFKIYISDKLTSTIFSRRHNRHFNFISHFTFRFIVLVAYNIMFI